MLKDATFADVIGIEELRESYCRTTVQAVEVFVGHTSFSMTQAKARNKNIRICILYSMIYFYAHNIARLISFEEHHTVHICKTQYE